MANPKYVKLSNGAKLIYKKQNISDTTDMTVGFSCGARCDGDYPGMSHFLEHMLFSTTKTLSKRTNDKINKHSLMQNAFTSDACIMLDFYCVNKELVNTLKYNVNMLLNRKFDKKIMDNEIQIIKQEIGMDIDKQKESAFGILYETLQPSRNADVLGNVASLKKVTPEMFQEYMDKYFITDNLIISVVSNKSLKEIKDLVEKMVVSKFKSNPENTINPVIETEYQEINPMIYLPMPEKETVALSIMLRQDNPNKNEYDKAIESIIFKALNGVGPGGKLFKKFREENNQAKAYSHYYNIVELPNMSIDFFSVRTAPKSIKSAMNGVASIIKELSQNGISQSEFNNAVKSIIEEDEAQKIKINDDCSSDLLLEYMCGANAIDDDLVIKYIKNMDYEEFNTMVMDKFSNPNIMATVEGNFDTRQCYNLAEIRQKIGHYVTKEELGAYNAPKIEYESTIKEDETQLTFPM